NAVIDALSPLGVRHVDMPLTAEKIWRLIDRSGSVARDDREQDVRRPTRAAVDRDLLAEDLGGSIARVVVLEGTDTGEDRTERSETRRRTTRILVVAPAHGEPDPVAYRHHDRGRPDLDVELVHLPRSQRLPFVVGVVRPIRQRQLRIELAVRGAEPCLGDRRVRVWRALE